METVEMPEIWLRMERGMTSQEQVLAKKIATDFPHGGRTFANRQARLHYVSPSLVNNTLAKMIMAGVIYTKSYGPKGTHIIVRDAVAWTKVARYPYA